MGTVTISGNTFTIYGTSAGFKEYMAGHIDSSNYDDAESTDRNKALVTATRWFERSNWAGDRTDKVTPQDLQHPRTGLTDKDGDAVASDTIHQDVIYGAYELANYLLGDATLTQNLDTGSNVKRAKAGSAEVEFFKGTDGKYPHFPTEVHNLIKWFLDSASGLSVPYVNSDATDQETEFDDEGVYGRNEGFA